jgi:hypothetical protein
MVNPSEDTAAYHFRVRFSDLDVRAPLVYPASANA